MFDEHVKLYRFVTLAAETGHIAVASDVYAKMEKVESSVPCLLGIRVTECEWLPSGSMVAVRPDNSWVQQCSA